MEQLHIPLQRRHFSHPSTQSIIQLYDWPAEFFTPPLPPTYMHSAMKLFLTYTDSFLLTFNCTNTQTGPNTSPSACRSKHSSPLYAPQPYHSSPSSAAKELQLDVDDINELRMPTFISEPSFLLLDNAGTTYPITSNFARSYASQMASLSPLALGNSTQPSIYSSVTILYSLMRTFSLKPLLLPALHVQFFSLSLTSSLSVPSQLLYIFPCLKPPLQSLFIYGPLPSLISFLQNSSILSNL